MPLNRIIQTHFPVTTSTGMTSLDAIDLMNLIAVLGNDPKFHTPHPRLVVGEKGQRSSLDLPVVMEKRMSMRDEAVAALTQGVDVALDSHRWSDPSVATPDDLAEQRSLNVLASSCKRFEGNVVSGVQNYMDEFYIARQPFVFDRQLSLQTD
jgi:hypothetical protein